MKIKAIITGSTGMVGEGVLLECLNSADIEQVLVINRKPGGISHPKLKEIIHGDFFNLAPITPAFSASAYHLWASAKRTINALPTT
jgi:nucleoside-diphosphate-sugar epimerase